MDKKVKEKKEKQLKLQQGRKSNLVLASHLQMIVIVVMM